MTTNHGAITEDDVHKALAFFIAIEPDPATTDSLEAWEAALAPYAAMIETANAMIRLYAEDMQPASLEEMRRRYFRFTNDERYLDTSLTSAVVTSVLQKAWDGVGPWRR